MAYLDWHVGMKVVCVDAVGIDDDYLIRPVKGHVYTIRTISANRAGDIGVRLVEVVNPQYEGIAPDNEGSRERGFFARRFRPVQPRPTSIAIFTAMLDSTKSKVRA